MDLSQKIQYLTLDIISTIGLGRSFDMLIEDHDVRDCIKNSEECLLIGIMFMAIGFGGLRQALFIGNSASPTPHGRRGHGRTLGMRYKWVDERWAKHEQENWNDMLALFIRHDMTRDEVRTKAIGQILAGNDTAASAFRGIFLYLMTNHWVCAKLRREVDEVVGGAGASG